MSGFAGVLAIDDAPADLHLTTLAPVPAPPGGWDDAGQMQAGPFGVRWGVRSTTPEARRERQPLSTADRRLTLVYSGRIDNRDELIARYGATPDHTDGELLLALFARDGADGLRHAVGDFVVVVWEPAAHAVWLARDAMGQRPLYIYDDGRAFFWSTDYRALAAGPARGRPWRREALADYLCWHPQLEPATLVDGIERLRPATWMRVARGARTRQASTYWAPSPPPGARRADDVLIEEFRHHFETAVTACLRGVETAACQLSGGLDSSLVAALVARQTRGLDTYSLVFPGLERDRAGDLVDESPFIDEMVDAIRARSTRWDPRDVTADDVWRLTRAHGVPPDAPNGDPLQWRLVSAAAADGHRVMLTGLGGDFWLTGSPAQLPARLSAGDWRGAWRFARQSLGPDALGTTPRQLAERVAAWLAPAPVKALWRQRPRPLPAWLDPDFAAEIRATLSAREHARRDAVASVRDLVLQDDLQVWALGEPVLAREQVWRTGTDAGVELRHPFADRRLAEFALHLPDDLRFRDGRTRHIQRAAFADVLPPRIRDRRSKGDGSVNTAIQLRLLLTMTPAVDAPRALVDAGLVRPAGLAEAWRRAVSGPPAAPSPDALPVFFAAALERCLRSGLGR